MFFSPVGPLPLTADLFAGTAKLATNAYRATTHAHPRASNSTLISHQSRPDDNNWKRDAHLAKAAYSGAEVEGFTLDSDLSTEKAKVYKDNQTGKVTIAYAGTELGYKSVGQVKRSIKDLWADRHILLGTEGNSSEFQDALKVANATIEKYGKDNVHATGHSLGGTKTTYVSSKTGIKGTTFGEGWSPLGAVRHATSVGDKWDYSKVTNYMVPGDIIGATTYVTPGRNVKTVRQDEKLANLKGLFKSKPYEAAAGVTAGQAIGAIPVVGQAAAALYAGYGTAKVGKALYDLHESDNYIQPLPKQAKATHTQDRVNTEDRVRPDRAPQPTHVSVLPETKASKKGEVVTTYQPSYGPGSTGVTAPYYSYGFARRHPTPTVRAERSHKRHRKPRRRVSRHG